MYFCCAKPQEDEGEVGRLGEKKGRKARLLLIRKKLTRLKVERQDYCE
jgi:hypothetical protein